MKSKRISATLVSAMLLLIGWAIDVSSIQNDILSCALFGLGGVVGIAAIYAWFMHKFPWHRRKRKYTVTPIIVPDEIKDLVFPQKLDEGPTLDIQLGEPYEVEIDESIYDEDKDS